MYKRIEVNKGDKYGDWEILKEVPCIYGRRFLCRNSRCKEKEVNLAHLRSGKSKGHYGFGIRSSTRTHGMAKTRIWNIWSHIKSRCLRKTDAAYRHYGGRGIKIDPKWVSFVGFYEDMKEGYDDSLTIERIDVNGNYCKENCKWIPKSEQSNNTRSNVFIQYKGEKKKLFELALEHGIKYHTLYGRIFNYGITIEEALTNKRCNRRWKVKPITR